MTLLRSITILITSLLCICCAAQTSEVASQLAVGKANMLDTYLSPEKYRGTELRYISDVLRDSKKRPVSYQLLHEANLGITRNRAHNARTLSGGYTFSYSIMRKWQLLDDKLLLRVGGVGYANLGFAYNTRNTANNPAQGYASVNIGPQVMATYNLPWSIKHEWPVIRLIYQTRMPLMGVMFSPNYGQSYYEMFGLGNYDHNVVFTTFTTFQMRQQLAVDIPLAQKTSVRLGYLVDIRQGKPNNLRQHHYYNAFTLGVVLKK